MKNIFLMLLCFVLVPALKLYPFSLSGIISDTSNNAINLATIKFIGLSDTLYDTVYSDQNGNYSISNNFIGTCQITAYKDKFYSQIKNLVLSLTPAIQDFHLVPIQSDSLHHGTNHMGTESGVWLPEGNPHVITGNIVIDNDLFISPGCTVLTESNSTVQINGNLTIGDNKLSTVVINNCTLSGGDLNISNTSLYKCNLNDKNNRTDNKLIVSNALFNYCSLEYKNGYYKSAIIKIDSSSFYNSDNTWIRCEDTLIITHCHFHSFNIAIGGNKVSTTNSIFEGSVYVSAILSNSHFTSDYSNYLQELSFRDNLNSEYICNINHCNIQEFIYPEQYNTTFIKNSILGSAQVCPLNNYVPVCDTTLYTSFFISNIFANSDQPEYPIFGLLDNNRINANGDSCDTWYNLKSNPCFIDSNYFISQSNSPAINAGDDGLNIGIYQGSGVKIKNMNIKMIDNSIYIKYSRNNQSIIIQANSGESYDAKICVYNMAGKIIEKYSKHNLKSDNAISIKKNVLPKGVYLFEVDINGKKYLKRIDVI